jgi:hypothetical protein
MLISILGVRFSERATRRKQRRIIWRRADSNQSSRTLITTGERFSCAKATFPRRSSNLNMHYVFIPTFRKPRKTCASPGKATLRFFRNRPNKDIWSSALGVARIPLNPFCRSLFDRQPKKSGWAIALIECAHATRTSPHTPRASSKRSQENAPSCNRQIWEHYGFTTETAEIAEKKRDLIHRSGASSVMS